MPNTRCQCPQTCAIDAVDTLTCPPQTLAITAIDTLTRAPQTCNVDAIDALITRPLKLVLSLARDTRLASVLGQGLSRIENDRIA